MVAAPAAGWRARDLPDAVHHGPHRHQEDHPHAGGRRGVQGQPSYHRDISPKQGADGNEDEGKN